MKIILYIFLLFPVFMHAGVLIPRTVNEMLDFNLKMEQLFVQGQYDEALEYFQILRSNIEKFPSVEKYLPVFREGIPFDKIIQKRKSLGNIKPKVLHKIAVFTLMNTDIDRYLDKDVEIKSTVSQEQQSKVSLAQEVFKKYVEVLSEGQWSIEFKEIPLDASLTHIFHSPGRSHGPMPDIHSIQPYPTLMIQDLMEEYDSFLFYWDDSVTKTSRSYGGMWNIPLVPYQLSAARRGYLRLIIQHNTGYSLLHEWWHAIEDMYSIRPYHAYQAQLRNHYPEWKGQGQWDYYQWHFQHTIQDRGIELADFSRFYPHNVTPNLILRSQMSVKSLTEQEKRTVFLEYNTAASLYSKNPRKAMKLLRNNLSINPLHPESLLLLAKAEYFYGDKKKSKRYIYESYAWNPFDKQVNYWLGVHSWQGKDYKAALRYMTEALELDPFYADAYYYRGTIYYAVKNWDACIKDCRNAIRIDDSFQKKIADWYQKKAAAGDTEAKKIVQALSN